MIVSSETRTVLLQSLNQMVLGLIVHYMIANSYVSEKISTLERIHLLTNKNKNIKYLMFQSQIIGTYNVFLFSEFTS